MITSETQARAFCEALCVETAMAQLDELSSALAIENKRQNLVSAASLDTVWQRHIADSLQLLKHVPRGTSPWLDLGTGAGFPGLAIAIARPDTEVVLVESRARRIDWLEGMIDRCGLENCRVEGRRLEHVEAFPGRVISARAFAPLERLLRLSARFSTPDTVWLLPKGRSAAQELQEQPEKVRKMFHVEQSLTDEAAKILVGKGKA